MFKELQGCLSFQLSRSPSEVEILYLPVKKFGTQTTKSINTQDFFSQDETENIKFDDLSKIVKDYEDYKKGRAITVERDHIVEIQMVSFAWDRAMANNEKVQITPAISKFIHNLDNLNCTLGVVNMKKQSAVKKFLSDYENTKGLSPNLLKYGVGPNTTSRICTAYEEAAGKIADKVKNGGKKVYDDFADEIALMIARAGI